MTTITSKFTKERLIDWAVVAVAERVRDLKDAPESVEAAANLKLAEITLASLTAEPVAYIFRHPAGELFWSLTDESNKGQNDVMPVYAAPPVPVMPAELHPDTQNLVADFCTVLAEKLYKAQLKYGYDADWKQDGWHTQCLSHFHQHIAKGDPRDVAAYCAFMWYHGWKTESVSGPVVPEGLRLALSNAGIAAPESDEMLAATCEKYIQMLVTWVKDRKPFQPAPVSVPDGLKQAVEFYEQVKQENTPVETGAWKDAVNWVLDEARRAALLQANQRDLSQPVDPQISEYEKIMLQAGNSPVIPDGYTLVPVEPTDEMIVAAMDSDDVTYNESDDTVFYVHHCEIYKAMLAAAPQPEVK